MTAEAESLLVSGYTRLSDNAEVRTAVDQIADLVSNMTIQLMKNGEKGDIRIKNDISKIVDIKPNSFMTRKQFIFWIVKTMLLSGDGNAFVLPIFRSGKLVELKPLPPSKISLTENDWNYSVNYAGQQYQPSELLHFVLNPDEDKPYKGNGYRVVLKDLTHILKQIQATKKSFMSSNYKPTLVFKIDSDADLDEQQRKEIEKKYLKRQNATDPLFLPQGLIDMEQVKPLSLNDLAINDAVKIDKATVANLLGVPPFLLGVGSYNKDEWNNFINTKIMSIAQIIQQTLTNLLIEDDEYFSFNPRSLFNYSLQEMVNAGVAMVKVNALRRNELRNWVGGLAPDAEMDDLIVLENYLLQADLSKQKKLNNDTEVEGGE